MVFEKKGVNISALGGLLGTLSNDDGDAKDDA